MTPAPDIGNGNKWGCLMFLKSEKKNIVSSVSRRSFDLPVFTSRILRFSMLVGMLFYQGVIHAFPKDTGECKEIPSYIGVTEDVIYECDVFDVSNVFVDTEGVSFISAEVLTRIYEGTGYISLDVGFTVAEGATFSASFVPDATYFGCSGNCHKW